MHAILSVGLIAQLGAALPADSIETLRDRARSAEARFERLSRFLAPVSWGSIPSYSECDEIVGRFCLRFDSTGQRPAGLETEAARVVDARREAVEAIRRYFSAAPADRRAAGPLVRLLIRDGRAAEAASAAGAFAALSGDTLWGQLLQGLAHHWAGSGVRAERHFVAAIEALPVAERRAWLDPEWLLDHSERRTVRRLSPEARADYERRYWLLTDPFWLTPENERWNEHVGRHVETRLLAEVPVVGGMVRWGRDLDELTVRYGTPTMRSRQRGGPSTNPGAGMVEYWDTAQRVYGPARLSGGLAPQPQPGERPALYAARGRTGYALQGVDRVVELAHQVTRFMRGDSVVVRVDAAMPLVPPGTAPYLSAGNGLPADEPPVDMAQPRVPPTAGLFVYDSAFTRRASATTAARIDGDTARFTLFAATPGGGLVYSAELLGDSGAISGRARYALDAHVPEHGPIVSDLLITQRFDAGQAPDRLDDPGLRAVESLIFRPGDTVGIYAEVYRLSRTSAVDVEVAFESADRPSLLGRLARWIGRGLGVVEEGDDPRVGWRGEPEDARYVVGLNVPLVDARTGMHDLVLRVTDPSTGESTEARRRVLIR